MTDQPTVKVAGGSAGGWMDIRNIMLKSTLVEAVVQVEVKCSKITKLLL